MELLIVLADIGIYSTIANIWRTYEEAKYKELRPNSQDTAITAILSYFILGVIIHYVH